MNDVLPKLLFTLPFDWQYITQYFAYTNTIAPYPQIEVGQNCLKDVMRDTNKQFVLQISLLLIWKAAVLVFDIGVGEAQFSKSAIQLQPWVSVESVDLELWNLDVRLQTECTICHPIFQLDTQLEKVGTVWANERSQQLLSLSCTYGHMNTMLTCI